jgi:hypothetical protein
MHRAAALGLITMLLAGLVACGPAPAPLSAPPATPHINYTAYYDCIDRGIKEAVNDEVLKAPKREYGGAEHPDFAKVQTDKDRIADQVLATCASRFGVMAQGRDRDMARVEVQDALNAIMHTDYESEMERRPKQAELDAPKMEAESAAATRGYGDCLFAHTRVLAINSSESAGIVVQAALASCAKEREAILDVHRRYHDALFNEDVLKGADEIVVPRLLLEVIRVRAVPPPSSPAPPQPAPPDKQI